MFETIALCAIISLAGFFQGITGFGSVLIALPLFACFTDIREAVPLLALFGLSLNVYLAWAQWSHIRWKRTLLLFAGTLPGIPLGLWMLRHGDVFWLQLVVAVVLIAFGLHGLWGKGFRKPPGKPWAAVAGFGCGFLSAAIAAGGPPVIVYAASQRWAKDEIKALMAGYFLLTGIMTSTGHALKGLVTMDTLVRFAIGFPFMLLAVVLGQKLYTRLSNHDYKKLVLLFVLGLGLLMLWRTLL